MSLGHKAPRGPNLKVFSLRNRKCGENFESVQTRFGWVPALVRQSYHFPVLYQEVWRDRDLEPNFSSVTLEQWGFVRYCTRGDFASCRGGVAFPAA